MNDIDEFLENVRDVREYKRAFVVSLVLQGYLADDIAPMVRVSLAFIEKWCRLYRHHGASVFRLGYSGSTPYLTLEERQSVIDWLRMRDTWDIDTLRHHLDTEYAVIFASNQSYYDLLHEAGLSYKKAQMTNSMVDPVRVAQKKKK